MTKALDHASIVPFLRERLFSGSGSRLEAVYLFGSTAAGRQRADSDLDVAILGSRPLDPVRVFEAAQDLAAEIGRDVDLVDLRSASTVLRAQVIGANGWLHVEDRAAVDAFEMYALADYARLQEERKDTVRAFVERYGG